jgi:predicted ArsR family transcriptional regulator
MTPVQELTLFQLQDHGPISAKAIAKRLNHPIESIYGALVHLEGKGRAEIYTHYKYAHHTTDGEMVRLWRVAP